jgi:vacuolar-type H+-ATPase subunit I/STV1
MSNNPFILQSLKHDFGDTLKLTQTETARKVLQRYYKNVTTRDLHVQTMPEESYIRELENIISDKEDMIKATNQTLNKILQDN